MKKLFTLIACGIFVLGITGCSNSSTPVGEWYNEEGTTLTINKDGSCKVSLAGADVDYYVGEEIKTCKWEISFEHEYRATVKLELSALSNSDDTRTENLINDMTFVTSMGKYVTWGGFKRK